MSELDHVIRQLRAEARALTPPPEPGAALLAEFAGVRTRRKPPVPRWLAAAAVTAAIAAIIVALLPVQKHTPATHSAAAAPPAVVLAAVQQPSEPAVAPRRRAHRKPVPPEPEAPFIQVPYTAPLAPGESADIVRADVPMSALIAAGFPFEVSDPGARARADLMIGPDGRTRAVRLISVSDSTSYRSIQ